MIDQPVSVDTLRERLTQPSIILVMGAGGVGKTTVAASCGLVAARAGLRALVVTIDPAKRLAQALGIEDLADTPAQVHNDLLNDAPGTLWASMLDTQETFDRMIRTGARSPEHAEQILSNRIYRAISSRFGGATEFMAMQRLWEFKEEHAWDVLILDTPPSRDAVDVLDAPQRLTGFLQGKLFKLFAAGASVAPKSPLRLVSRSAGAFVRLAGKVTGTGLLQEIGTFVSSLDTLAGDITSRAASVRHLLERPDAGAVIVSTAAIRPLAQAEDAVERLRREGIGVFCVVANQLPPAVDAKALGCMDELTESADKSIAAAATLALRESDRRATGIARLQSTMHRLHVDDVALIPRSVDASGPNALDAAVSTLEHGVPLSPSE